MEHYRLDDSIRLSGDYLHFEKPELCVNGISLVDYRSQSFIFLPDAKITADIGISTYVQYDLSDDVLIW
jgi:hypothetical protein